jgi:hypothetical protein
MGPNARRGFANLLGNLDTGVLRIGGSSQDLVPFNATAPNTLEVIAPDDLASIRATLDMTNAGDPHGDRRNSRGDAPRWGKILGTAMAPVSARRPSISVDHARAFTEQTRSTPTRPRRPGMDLAYRVEELNTASGRGANGVSNVAGQRGRL